MGNQCGKRCHPRLGDYTISKGLLVTRGVDDIRRHYKIGKELGSGSFGQVRECTKRGTNEVFAVKIIERKMTAKDKMIPGRPSNEQMMRSEVNILKMLDHPHIVKYVDFFEDRYFFYAVLELLAGGELFYRIVKRTKLTEQDASMFCKQMISALAYLHERQIVHRDIKAENFMYKDNSPDSVVKLIDFGMSTRLPESGYLTDLCGSPHYISPELIERHYGCSVDMWAFGVMLFLMLFGRYPFEGSKPALIAKEVQTKDIDWTAEECLHLTDSCIDFVSRLLDRNPKTRLTAAQALQHPWIASDSKLKELSVIKRENLELARRRSVKSEHQGNSRVAARVNSRMELAEREYLQGRQRAQQTHHESRGGTRRGGDKQDEKKKKTQEREGAVASGCEKAMAVV